MVLRYVQLMTGEELTESIPGEGPGGGRPPPGIRSEHRQEKFSLT